MKEIPVSAAERKKNIAEAFQVLSFQVRLFYLFGAMGVTSSVLAFISSVVNRLPEITVRVSFICMLCMFGNGVFFMTTKRQQPAAVMCCITINLIMFPLLFLFSGGAHSGMPLYFLLGLTVSALILVGVTRIIILAAGMVIDTAVLLLYYDYPGYFLELSHEMQRSDMISSFWIVGMFFAVVLLMLMREVQKEHKRLIEYNRKLKEKNYLDELTGLYNHRFVSKQLEKFCCERGDEDRRNSLAVIMMDIDFFKQVNDSFGHLRGNDVLIRFAQILAEYTQEDCFVTRYGGEEFLILLYNSSAERAGEIGEQIRRRVEFDKSLRKLTEGGITVSGGIARYQEDMTAADLIELADKRLYQAKNTGRNRIAG